MAYTPIGDKTVQNWIDLLSVDAQFAALTEEQQIQYINFCQQECASLSKKYGLESFKVTDNMYST